MAHSHGQKLKHGIYFHQVQVFPECSVLGNLLLACPNKDAALCPSTKWGRPWTCHSSSFSGKKLLSAVQVHSGHLGSTRLREVEGTRRAMKAIVFYPDLKVPFLIAEDDLPSWYPMLFKILGAVAWNRLADGLLFSLPPLTVLVECSHFNFLTVAKRALFYRDELGGPDELFLGTGCQAIRVRPDELEFDYPVSLCGIVTQVREGIVFLSTVCKIFGSIVLCLFLL